MIDHIQGVQFKDGQLALVGTQAGPNGIRVPVFIPVDFAATMGCWFIELAQLAKEREAELKASGKVLDINTMVGEMTVRLQQRGKLNNHDISVNFGQATM